MGRDRRVSGSKKRAKGELFKVAGHSGRALNDLRKERPQTSIPRCKQRPGRESFWWGSSTAGGRRLKDEQAKSAGVLLYERMGSGALFRLIAEGERGRLKQSRLSKVGEKKLPESISP